MEENVLKNLLNCEEFLEFEEFLNSRNYSWIKTFCPVEYIQEFISTMNADRNIEIMNICIELYPQIIGFFKEN